MRHKLRAGMRRRCGRGSPVWRLRRRRHSPVRDIARVSPASASRNSLATSRACRSRSDNRGESDATKRALRARGREPLRSSAPHMSLPLASAHPPALPAPLVPCSSSSTSAAARWRGARCWATVRRRRRCGPGTRVVADGRGAAQRCHVPAHRRDCSSATTRSERSARFADRRPRGRAARASAHFAYADSAEHREGVSRLHREAPAALRRAATRNRHDHEQRQPLRRAARRVPGRPRRGGDRNRRRARRAAALHLARPRARHARCWPTCSLRSTLPAGARVAVQIDKSVEALMLYLAVLRAGLRVPAAEHRLPAGRDRVLHRQCRAGGGGVRAEGLQLDLASSPSRPARRTCSRSTTTAPAACSSAPRA